VHFLEEFEKKTLFPTKEKQNRKKQEMKNKPKTKAMLHLK
jgi:hypothetical protein